MILQVYSRGLRFLAFNSLVLINFITSSGIFSTDMSGEYISNTFSDFGNDRRT
jgi:hypothetical protein